MKKLCVFLSFVLAPVMAVGEPDLFQPFFEIHMANNFSNKITHGDDLLQFWNVNTDRCTENGKYKSEYTIDRRCYVTDEQKQIFPYNTVVKISNTCGECTGVIVKDKYDGNLYIYSAGHCVDCHFVGKSDITLQNGKKLKLKHMLSQLDDFADFAIFEIPKSEQAGMPYTEVAGLTYTDVDNVGYGALPILNDKQINEAKYQWAKFVDEYGGEDDIMYQLGLAGLKSRGGFAAAFASSYRWLDNQNALKASLNCDVVKQTVHERPSINKRACQGFHGNSGGPFFNRAGKVVAVVSKGDDNSTVEKYYEYPRGLEQKASSIQYKLRQKRLEPHNQQMLMDMTTKQIQQVGRDELRTQQLLDKQNQRILNKQYQ